MSALPHRHRRRVYAAVLFLVAAGLQLVFGVQKIDQSRLRIFLRAPAPISA